MTNCNLEELFSILQDIRLGKTRKIRSRILSSKQWIARHVIALPTCLAFSILYKRLPIGKKRRAVHKVCKDVGATQQCLMFQMRGRTWVFK